MQLVAYRNTMRNAVPVHGDRETEREEAREREQRLQAGTIRSIVDEIERRKQEEARQRDRVSQERAKVAELLERGRQAARRFNSTEATASFHRIVARICRATGVSRHDLFADRRNGHLVLARQAVMYWACRRTGLSLPQIGRMMGGRDHTTVLWGKKVYREKRAKMGRTLREVL